MKYFRFMSQEELAKVLKGEAVIAMNKWFLEKPMLYFMAEKDGGFEAVLWQIDTFAEAKETSVIVEFESTMILETHLNEYGFLESIVEQYDSTTMRPIRWMHSYSLEENTYNKWFKTKEWNHDFSLFFIKRTKEELKNLSLQRKIVRRNETLRRKDVRKNKIFNSFNQFVY